MLFQCTPGVLAKHLLEAIAVSDRVSLQDLWALAKHNLSTETVDNFQKNVIWRALAAQGADTLFVVHIGSQLVTSAAHLSYGTLLLHGDETNIWIVPTDKCKYLYLTGTSNYQKIITALGEKPVELLGVIARHGLAGVVNSILAQESNQDIRSIGVRLQKLESAGLITCQNVYLDKKHTNQSTHVRFVPESLVAKQNADVEDDIRVTRDAKRLRTMILDALKQSSNHMRGFSDLRKDFKLEGSASEVKFFKAVCNRLHHGGYIEKLHVELPHTKQRVYAIRFLKDINPTDELNEAADTAFDIKDEFSEDEAAESPQTKEVPCFNQIFTPFHQMFLQITKRGEAGITIGEITKNILGTSDFRPYNRVFEQLPTYLSNSKTLKTFKKYAEPYDDYSVTKLYDHEGKVKFYRYFVTDFCKESRPKPKNYVLAPKPNKMSLKDWEKKLALSLGKISTDSLLKKKERLLNPSDSPVVLPKKRERVPKSEKIEHEEKLDTLELAQMAIDEQGGRPKRARRAVSYSLLEALLNEEDNKDGVFIPDSHMEEESAEDAEVGEEDDDDHETKQFVEPRLKLEVNAELSIAADVVEFDTSQRTPKPTRRVIKDVHTPRTLSSLSSQKRRDELIKILSEAGGAAVVSGALKRALDQRLDKTTETDNKTLMRDVSALVKDGHLETRLEQIGPEGRQIKRTLLILTSHKTRLTDERMDELRTQFFQDSLKKKVLNRRLIEAELNFLVEQPKQLVDVELTTKRRERAESRLRAVDDGDSSTAAVKMEPCSTPVEALVDEEDENVFESIKNRRKARKVPQQNLSNTSVLGVKRPRRSLKLEKDQATTIYRAVIIHRAFSKEAIDFGSIAQLIGETDKELVRRKWSTLRRLFGGAEAISKGVETFQSMVMQGVDEGSITADDLIHYNPEFFLRFWKKFDVNAELNITDRMPLLATYALNEKRYDLSISTEQSPVDLAEKVEETSMRQKEGILANAVFTCNPPENTPSKDHQELRSVLKSILSIDENELNSTAAKEILKAYNSEEIQIAAESMIRDREILLISLDDRKKFVLSERFHTTLTSRIFTKCFFHDAELFRVLVDDTTRAKKGLVVSPGILSGEMAALLQQISDNSVNLIRVDRALKFENYESRLIDREQIACDIIVHGTSSKRISKSRPVITPVPLVGACKPVWINLKTEINAELWSKVVMILLYHVVFKPGIPRTSLGTKLQVLLNNTDFDHAIGWLVENLCLVENEGALTATSTWQYILGN